MLSKIKLFIFSEFFIKKFIAYFLLFIILYLLKDFLFVFLLTFLFAYFSFIISKSIFNFLKSYVKVNFLNKIIKLNFIVSVLYLLYIFIFVYFVSHLVPLLLTELNSLSKHIPFLSEYIQSFVSSLNNIQHTKEVVSSDFDKLITEKNISIILNTINHIKAFGGGLLKFLLAFILSFFFIIDRKRLKKYLQGIKKSSLSFLYYEYRFLFSKIAKGFLLIFRAQAKIALTNTILTFLGLQFISLIIGSAIPYIGILTILVFFFSFVPVLGVIISSIPIALVVYNIAGFFGLISVIVMILIIHAIEAYILNPRFISDEVELPVSLTFLLLLLGEHFFGAIGLIIAVPLFFIIVEIISDIDKSFKQSLKKVDKSN